MKWLVLLAIAACGSSANNGTDGGGDDDGNGSGSDIGGSCSAAPDPETGDGTYYNADGTGNCSFDADSSFMVVAMNHTDYGNSEWCGACISVTGPKGTVTVRVTDQCPECAKGALDLSETAFDMIADHAAGRVSVTWHEVPCDVTGPIGYHFKAGDTQYYTALQIRNTRYPIAKVEAMVNGAYQDIPRKDYNYFVPDAGLGKGPFQFRVTDQRGHVVEDTGIALGDDETRDGAAQFQTCE
ncbi:MAG: expansin EXLX1 family cellulose-binding protein [Kofleriaceae bacterium]